MLPILPVLPMLLVLPVLPTLSTRNIGSIGNTGDTGSTISIGNTCSIGNTVNQSCDYKHKRLDETSHGTFVLSHGTIDGVIGQHSLLTNSLM